MAKKKNTKPAEPINVIAEQPKAEPIQKAGFSFTDFRVQSVILAILGLIFYFNSFSNDYALDDGIIIAKNEYVQAGFKGIPIIMTGDAFESYYSSLNASNQLAGGRYRPLSIVTFAIEQQLFGSGIDYSKVATYYGVRKPEEAGFIQLMHIRHVVNVALYILAVIVLLYFLRTIVFKTSPVTGFLTALLFIIHPIHTEVVANVKSRDEIMSLLFICLTFIYAYRYSENKKIITLLLGLLFYFLAMLSKEYGITLLALIPLMFYLFKSYSIPQSIKATIPYAIVLGLYVALRFSVIAPKADSSDDEILNNPYLFATGTETIASEIAILFKYLKLQLFPHPLSSDYSYKQIPYSNFSSIIVWLSLLIHAGMVAAMFFLFKKRHVLCFALAFYLLNLALVSNLVFDIGATMGERLIFHSSLGFCMTIAWLLNEGYKKIKPATTATAALVSLLLLLIVLSGFKTIERNAEWKNDNTLFLKDVITSPNSAMTNANAGACYIGMSELETTDSTHAIAYVHEAVKYLNKSIQLHSTFYISYLNRGIAYYKLGMMDSAKNDFDALKKYFPSYPTLPTLYSLLGSYYLKVGWEIYGKVGKYNEAIAVFQKGLEAEPNNADLWYNIGGAEFSLQNYPKAYEAWQNALKINPQHPQALKGIQALNGVMKK